MKRRRIILISAAVALVLLALLPIAFWPDEKEPEYHGKKLSEWLFLADEKGYAYVRPDNEPVQAVKAIGTNAIPFLLKWVGTEDKPRLMTLSIEVRRLPKFWGRDAIVNGLRERAFSFSTRMRGLSGFQILGPEAVSAVPALTTIARDRARPHARYYALRSLAFLGHDGVKPVLDTFRDRNEPADVRLVAADALRFMTYLGLDVAPAIPDLIASLSETNKSIDLMAARTLKSFAMRSTPVEYGLPNLPRMTRCEDARLRSATMEALRDAHFGSDPPFRPEVVQSLSLIWPSVLADEATERHE
jgi:hypothetical protein